MTLEDAQAALQRWHDAEKAVSTGTSYSIGGRSLTRADIADIRDQITYWSREVKRYNNIQGFMTPSWL